MLRNIDPALLDTRRFVEWLETQPPEKSYRYTMILECAAAQYLQAHGVSQLVSMLTPAELKKIGWHGIVFWTPSTFGAAAWRGRKIINGTWWYRLWKKCW